jgi:hypothetical protein
MRIVTLAFWLLVAALVVWLALYVTYLLVVRLRQGASPVKSFFAWLRDLFDIATGLG